MTRPIVFSTETVRLIERQLASLSPQERPTIWQHATQPRFERLRSWLDSEISTLQAGTQMEFLSRLRSPRLHTASLAEIATGYALRLPGYQTEFGPRLSGLTPDILLTHPEGRQMIIEVWRRGISDSAARGNAGWIELGRQIRRIPTPVTLALRPTTTPIEPPDAIMRASIERGLRNWLSSPKATVGASEPIEAIHFWIVGDTPTGHAELLPVREGTTATRDDIVHAIERKTKKYRRLAQQSNLPFLVVVGADENTSLTANQVDSVLSGHNSVSISIPLNSAGATTSGPISLRKSEAPPVFDAALSAVAWLDVNQGIDVAVGPWWHNPLARRPLEVI